MNNIDKQIRLLFSQNPGVASSQHNEIYTLLKSHSISSVKFTIEKRKELKEKLKQKGIDEKVAVDLVNIIASEKQNKEESRERKEYEVYKKIMAFNVSKDYFVEAFKGFSKQLIKDAQYTPKHQISKDFGEVTSEKLGEVIKNVEILREKIQIPVDERTAEEEAEIEKAFLYFKENKFKFKDRAKEEKKLSKIEKDIGKILDDDEKAGAKAGKAFVSRLEIGSNKQKNMKAMKSFTEKLGAECVHKLLIMEEEKVELQEKITNTDDDSPEKMDLKEKLLELRQKQDEFMKEKFPEIKDELEKLHGSTMSYAVSEIENYVKIMKNSKYRKKFESEKLKDEKTLSKKSSNAFLSWASELFSSKKENESVNPKNDISAFEFIDELSKFDAEHELAKAKALHDSENPNYSSQHINGIKKKIFEKSYDNMVGISKPTSKMQPSTSKTPQASVPQTTVASLDLLDKEEDLMKTLTLYGPQKV